MVFVFGLMIISTESQVFPSLEASLLILMQVTFFPLSLDLKIGHQRLVNPGHGNALDMDHTEFVQIQRETDDSRQGCIETWGGVKLSQGQSHVVERFVRACSYI